MLSCRGENDIKIKLFAPFKTDFNILWFYAMKDYDEFIFLFDRIKQHYKTNKHIEFSTPSHEEFRFKHIQEDGNNMNPEIFITKKDPALFEIMHDIQYALDNEYHAFHMEVDRNVDDTICYIFDNGIGVLESSITLKDKLHETDEQAWSNFFHFVQDYSNVYMEYLTNRYYESKLRHYIADMKQLDMKGFIQNQYENRILLNKHNRNVYKMKIDMFKYNTIGIPLWVNRTVCLSSLENKKDILCNHWLALDTENRQDVADKIKHDQIYLGWGNNVMVGKPADSVYQSAMKALILSQYYNVILDDLNNQLSNLIGDLFSIKRYGRHLKDTEILLETYIENAELIFMQLDEQQINLQGHRKKYFSELTEKYKLDIIKQNIENKISFSREKMNYFYRQKTKLNHTISESILIGIGGIALVDFFANVSQLSRNIKVNPDMVEKDTPSIGFVDLGMILSPNNMIWTGFGLMFLILLYFIVVKRRS